MDERSPCSWFGSSVISGKRPFRTSGLRVRTHGRIRNFLFSVEQYSRWGRRGFGAPERRRAKRRSIIQIDADSEKVGPEESHSRRITGTATDLLRKPALACARIVIGEQIGGASVPSPRV